MAKCDTATTAKDLLRDDGARDGWCRRCFKDFLDSEGRGIRCQECKVIHLKERSFEKIVGWLCFDCAKQYDEELLKKLTSAANA
jgi:DNA-directed RNA polymerase subunit RPC12/RpoP